MAQIENILETVSDQVSSSPNRANRRKARLDSRTKERNNWVSTYNALTADLNQSTARMNQVIKAFGGNLTQMIYQGEPFIVHDLDTSRRLHTFIEQVVLVNPRIGFTDQAFITKLKEEDMYTMQLRGTSLLDIESMPPPLSAEDIVRINKMFYQTNSFNFFRRSRETPKERIIRQSMMLLASQKTARPEERIKIPEGLTPLYLRLVNYFDYYTHLITNLSKDYLSEGNFMHVLVWGRPWIPQAIGCYLPGRLGITPSSAVKLFSERAYNLGVYSVTWGSAKTNRGLMGYLTRGASKAVRKNSLPEQISRYQHYDFDNEQIVTNMLQRQSKSIAVDRSEVYGRHLQAESLLNRLSSQRESLIRDIQNSRDKFLTISLPEDEMLRTITLASQYRQTLMFILQFLNGGHLTLEYAQNSPSGIDKPDHLYGLPIEVIKSGSYLRDFIINKLLTATFDNLTPPAYSIRGEKPQPQVEEDKEVSPQTVTEPAEDILVYVPTPKIKVPKIRRILTPIGQVLSQEPSVPEPGDFSYRKYHVMYSQDQISEKLGRKVKPKTLDRISEAIGRFEFGWESSVKIIDWSGGKRYVFRVGDLRIVLNHLGKGEFLVDGIGDRRYIYRHYGDFKV